MKKAFIVFFVALVALAGCASPPPPAPVLEVATPPYDILQHKGTTLGVTTIPAWIPASLEGPKAVEKLPDYKGMFVVVVDVTGRDLEGTSLVAQRLNADAEISRYLSLRVKDTFAGAQVGDKDKIESYIERTVKSVSEARFSGFQRAADWWVQYRWYKDAKKRQWERDEFRVLQLYTVDKEVLELQLQKYLEEAEEAETPKTPEKQRAMDLVQQSFFDGF